MRWKLTIEYDGGPFQGWQRQDNGPSVQAAVEQAIQKLTGESVTIAAAGRTDTGVHALGQVAHADIAKELAPDKMRDALNRA
jgi:tRNA pseudouridine38-40 synthase